MSEQGGTQELGDAEAGYRLVNVYALQQSHRVVSVEDLSDPEEGQISFHWDWRVDEWDNERDAVSSLSVKIELGVQGRQEQPESVTVELVGVFQVVGRHPSIGLEPFVMHAATAILLPYARERIASLMAAGPYGEKHFPILNVLRLMERMEFEKSAGAQQIAKRTADVGEEA